MDGNIEKMQSLTGRIKGLGIDKTLTKKGMCAEAEATGKALATKVSKTDIVDDFLSVATDKPLSANQGRLLKKQIDDIDPHNAENVIYNNADKDTNADNMQDVVDEVKGIVGYKKNKLRNTAMNKAGQGITHTVNADKTVIATGTNDWDSNATLTIFAETDKKRLNLTNGKGYILNGCPANGSANSYSLKMEAYNKNNELVNTYTDYGNGVTFAYDKALLYKVYTSIAPNYPVSNLKFKPMISIEGGTYEPYVEDIQARLDDVVRTLGTLKSYNELNINATSQTVAGISYTFNADGTVRVVGTATDTSFIELDKVNTNTKSIPVGEHIISGGKDGVIVRGTYNNGQGINYGSADGAEAVIEVTENMTSSWCRMLVEKGSTVDTTIYPMVRPSYIEDDTYRPYKPSGADRFNNKMAISTLPFTAPYSGIATVAIQRGIDSAGLVGAVMNIYKNNVKDRIQYCYSYSAKWGACSFTIPLAKGERIEVDGAFAENANSILYAHSYFMY